MGLTDNQLRRQLTATRSTVWNNLTSLIQHMSHMLSFEVVQSDNWNPGMTVHNDGSEFPEFNEPSYHKFQPSTDGETDDHNDDHSDDHIDDHHIQAGDTTCDTTCDDKTQLNAGMFDDEQPDRHCNFCKGRNAGTHNTEDCRYLARMLPYDFQGFNKRRNRRDNASSSSE
jgi:hypothetical protein